MNSENMPEWVDYVNQTLEDMSEILNDLICKLELLEIDVESVETRLSWIEEERIGVNCN